MPDEKRSSVAIVICHRVPDPAESVASQDMDDGLGPIYDEAENLLRLNHAVG